MTSVAKMNVAVGWSGGEADKGVAGLSNKLESTGKTALKTGASVTEGMKEASDASKKVEEAFEKSLLKMNALEQKNAREKKATKERRSTMSAEDIEADINKEKMKYAQKDMNALEKLEDDKKRRDKERRKNMTAEELRAEDEKLKKKADAEKRWESQRPVLGSKRLGAVVDSAANIKATFDMASKAIDLFIVKPVQAIWETMKLASELQEISLVANMISGRNFDAFGNAAQRAGENVTTANSAVETLRDTSKSLGVPLTNLTKALIELQAVGQSETGAMNLIQGMQNAIVILGGSAAAADTVKNSLIALNETTQANKASLRSLQMGGINVYRALAEEMTRTYGRAVSQQEAMRLLEANAVDSALAQRALLMASATPEAAATAKALGNQFNNLIESLFRQFEDIKRDIGKTILQTFSVENIVSGIKGFVDGAQTVIKEAMKLMEITDQALKNMSIEEAFSKGKVMAIEITATLVEAAMSFSKMLEVGVNKFIATIKTWIDELKGLIGDYEEVKKNVAAVPEATGNIFSDAFAFINQSPYAAPEGASKLVLPAPTPAERAAAAAKGNAALAAIAAEKKKEEENPMVKFVAGLRAAAEAEKIRMDKVKKDAEANNAKNNDAKNNQAKLELENQAKLKNAADAVAKSVENVSLAARNAGERAAKLLTEIGTDQEKFQLLMKSSSDALAGNEAASKQAMQLRLDQLAAALKTFEEDLAKPNANPVDINERYTKAKALIEKQFDENFLNRFNENQMLLRQRAGAVKDVMEKHGLASETGTSSATLGSSAVAEMQIRARMEAQKMDVDAAMLGALKNQERQGAEQIKILNNINIAIEKNKPAIRAIGK